MLHESRYASSSMSSRHRIVIYILAVVIGIILLNFFFQYNSVYKDLSSYNHKLHVFRDSNNIKNKNDINEGQCRNDLIMDKCEVIHIGFVCSGHKSVIALHTLLKSLFFYRLNPIHFHMIVDNFTRNILNTLFESWNLPKTQVTYYSLNDSVLDIRWVPNSHYSGVFGLLKLVFPKIVPASVTNRIIVLDTDLTFVADIGELWALFNDFNATQSIGIVDNQSNFYLGKLGTSRPWPAIGRGYNTGLMLYRLDRLRARDWMALWSETAKRVALTHGAASLGDQDVVNAVFVHHPELLYEVPCNWNTQLSDFTLSYNCYKEYRLKIIHWNSPRKTHVNNRDGDYFRSMYSTFLEYNGNLLKKQLHYCNETNHTNEKSSPDVCAEFRRGMDDKWRTILFFQKYDYKPSENDVTFVAQLSYDRLQLVEDLAKLWEGPLGLAFYLTDPEFEKCLDFIQNSEILKNRRNIAYHVIFKEGVYYPINMLRNVGLKNVNTPYVFLADIDFMPMKGLYKSLKESVAAPGSMKSKALIVAAFETQSYKTLLPKSKSQLLQMIDTGKIFSFRHDVWQPGHAPTNYNKWRISNKPYQIKWAPDFEPYFVVRSDVTEYDNRFMGFGWNKVSHAMELNAQGYEWIVLSNAFIIHKAHAPSNDIVNFRASPTYRMCLHDLKEEFVQQLKEKYGKDFDNKNTILNSDT